MTFGAKIRSLRESKRISQLEAAELLGIGNKTLSDYERDRSEPDIVTLKKISQFYGVDLNVLIGDSPFNSSATDINEFEFALYDEVKDLTDAQKSDLLEMVRILKKQINSKE